MCAQIGIFCPKIRNVVDVASFVIQGTATSAAGVLTSTPGMSLLTGAVDDWWTNVRQDWSAAAEFFSARRIVAAWEHH